MTDADLGREYRSVADALGFTFGEMCRIAVDAVEATWLDEGERAALRRSFEDTISLLVAEA
jgi:adenosine deaminase